MKIPLAELYPGFDLECPAIKDPIEAGIRPVCDALNAIEGVHTLWSCEGHPEQPAKPYVTFIAPQDVAFRIHQLLSLKSDRGDIKYHWTLSGNFRQDGTLQYTVSPQDYRLDAARLWLFRPWSQKAMAAELLLLAKLLAQAS